jgi:hypothetical protein
MFVSNAIRAGAGRCVFVVIGVMILAGPPSSLLALDFPGPPPGQAMSITDAKHLSLENAVIGLSWRLSDGRLLPGAVVDRLSNKKIVGGAEVFEIVLTDGRTYRASGMKLDPPHCEDIAADPRALRASSRCAGKRVSATLTSDDGALLVNWRAILRDGDNYVHQELTLRPRDKNLLLTEICFGEFSADGARAAGSVLGSPVVAGNMFFACEHSLARNEVQGNRIRCRLPWKSPIKAGQSFDCSSVAGVVPAGQMRRAFLYYIERQRPRPYRPFLHYNSWYDIQTPIFGGNEMDETHCLKAIELIGKELVKNRGVRLDSLVFDDGWSDSKRMWDFHAGFPRGFAPLRDAAARYESGIGVWMSPFGGYGGPKEERLKYGQTQGLEINSRGFALAGPKYFACFRNACRRMIERYNVNFFKFDGIAAGLEYEKLTAEDLADIAALLRLCNELRQLRPDVYLSLTTGTWASPYWLWYGDSIWRTGDDMGFCGEGSRRQQWINYRDANTQQTVVRRGPLFPLNSLMNQGIAQAKLGCPGGLGNDLKDIVDEIRMFFGDGTQLQELYIAPQLLTPAMWDALAEAAAWSRDNADVLVDTHWIGGDAGKGEPYGYASWSPRKGILCVRNPSKQPKTMPLKLAEAFEHPQGAPKQYLLKSPWKADAGLPTRTIAADEGYRIELRPFEVLILEAKPRKVQKRGLAPSQDPVHIEKRRVLARCLSPFLNPQAD